MLDQSGADGQDKGGERAALMSKLDARPSNGTINELSGANLTNDDQDENMEPGPSGSVKSIGQSGLAKGALPSELALPAPRATKLLRSAMASGGSGGRFGSTQGQSSDMQAPAAAAIAAANSTRVAGTESEPDKLLAELVYESGQNEWGPRRRHKQSSSALTPTPTPTPTSSSSSSSSSSHSSGKPSSDKRAKLQFGTILDREAPLALGDVDVSLRKELKPAAAASSSASSDAIRAKSNLFVNGEAAAAAGNSRLAASLNRQLNSPLIQARAAATAAAALHRRNPIAATSNNNDNELRLAGGASAAAAAARRQRAHSLAAPDQYREIGAEAGEAGEEQEETPQVGVPRELEEAVRRQVAEQLSPESPFGRQINKQLSDYFGEPVEIRAAISSSPKSLAPRRVAGAANSQPKPKGAHASTSRRPASSG